MNSDIENIVINTILKQCKEQDSAAYFEVLCGEVFGEMNRTNEKKLTSILESLKAKGEVKVNGDRISVIKIDDDKRSCDFLFVDEGLSEMINNSGLKVNYGDVDIGHGTNWPAICAYMQQNVPLFISGAIWLGVELSKVQKAYEFWGGVVKKLKEVKDNYKQRNNEEAKIYLGENLLIAIVFDKIFKTYNLSCGDLKYINIVNSTRTKIGALGYYSMHHQNYEEETLQGSPEAINYFVVQLASDKLPLDYQIITCEILTNGQIKYFNTQNITLENNF